MRLRKMLLVALPIALGGCGALGASEAGGPASSAPPAPSTTPWFLYASGSATPSPGLPRRSGSLAPALPAVSFLAIDPNCGESFTRMSEVLIPLKVTPGKGSLAVSWPRQYNSGYRLTAVKQPLVNGNQPNYTWQNVAAGSGCTVSATIKGLKSGTPYVVWLDAPNTGYEPDGTRHLYSGRSTVVRPL